MEKSIGIVYEVSRDFVGGIEIESAIREVYQVSNDQNTTADRKVDRQRFNLEFSHSLTGQVQVAMIPNEISLADEAVLGQRGKGC